MYFVFNATDKNAQKYLFPRYDPDAVDTFSCAKEMITCLTESYVNPYRVEDARYKYNALTIRSTQTFYEFRTEFLHLTDKAQVPTSERFNHLYNKLTIPLYNRLLNIKHTFSQNLQELCKVTGGINTDL